MQVIESFAPGASDVRGADLDGDGDADVLASMYDISRVTWYRNESPPQVAGDFDRDGEVTAADVDLLCGRIRSGNTDLGFDLNDDGVLDRSDLNRMITQILGTTAGDANLDEVFNSGDLVQVFTAGEYEDGIPGNSTWAEGDWNCDGEFDSSDMVAAFQAGSYEAASQVASRTDPLAIRPGGGHGADFRLDPNRRGTRSSRGGSGPSDVR